MHYGPTTTRRVCTLLLLCSGPPWSSSSRRGRSNHHQRTTLHKSKLNVSFDLTALYIVPLMVRPPSHVRTMMRGCYGRRFRNICIDRACVCLYCLLIKEDEEWIDAKKVQAGDRPYSIYNIPITLTSRGWCIYSYMPIWPDRSYVRMARARI